MMTTMGKEILVLLVIFLLQNGVELQEPTSSSSVSDTLSMDRNRDRITFRILISGGLKTGRSKSYSYVTSETEVIDLENDLSCANFDDYPLKVVDATGGLIAGQIPIVCGGYAQERKTERDQCYNLLNQRRIGRLSERKQDARSVVMPDGTLWVTGGYSHGQILKSTDFVGPTEAKPGPELPKEMLKYCMVKLSSSQILFIAGINYMERTWIYSVEKKRFNIRNDTGLFVPDLNVGRYGHSCGLIHDTIDGSPMVVVVGGKDRKGKPVTSTEVWMVGTRHWILLEDANSNRGVHDAISVVAGSGLYLIGGAESDPDNEDVAKESRDIYKFSCVLQDCQWERLRRTQLSSGRRNAVAMLVPDVMTNCRNA